MTEKAKGSRIRGFKGSSGLLGIFFQNIKAKGSRIRVENVIDGYSQLEEKETKF